MTDTADSHIAAARAAAPDSGLVRLDPISDLWRKNAIVYCVDVKTFVDFDGDGCGDFQGLVERVDSCRASASTACG